MERVAELRNRKNLILLSWNFALKWARTGHYEVAKQRRIRTGRNSRAPCQQGKKVDQASLKLVDMIMEVYLLSFSIHLNGRKRNWHLGILRPRQHGCVMVGRPQPGVEPEIGSVFLKSVLLRILCDAGTYM
jgi:hypothetical protein